MTHKKVDESIKEFSEKYPTLYSFLRGQWGMDLEVFYILKIINEYEELRATKQGELIIKPYNIDVHKYYRLKRRLAEKGMIVELTREDGTFDHKKTRQYLKLSVEDFNNYLKKVSKEFLSFVRTETMRRTATEYHKNQPKTTEEKVFKAVEYPEKSNEISEASDQDQLPT